MDQDKLRALSDFYREEFLRHIELLELHGLVSESSREAIDRARRRVLGGLDHVCWRADFPAVAETLLRSFDALTHLSELDPKQGH